jgi:carbamoyl-phosphate synthase small subunit
MTPMILRTAPRSKPLRATPSRDGEREIFSLRPTLTLTLEDGTQLTGESFGAHAEAAGEVVFNTGMVGYPESFTDPSYTGQILTLTYPLIGNYGVPQSEKTKEGLERFFESEKIRISAVVVSEYSEQPHHWQAKETLGQWLAKNGIPGITGIDTRALTEHLRTKGAMLGILTKSPGEKIPFYDPDQENLVAKVSPKKTMTYGDGSKHIALVDCGMKYNILRNFLSRGIKVTRVPWNHNVWDMKTKFDGIFFSNGPGDPALMKETVEIMKKGIEKKVPTFGICLGSQIMGIAAGGKTYKLKFGHRSQNQPCIDTETGRCYITSQNHGFAVDAKSMGKDWKMSMVNANDGSVEGVKHKKLPFFSVQYHPEATPGPNDSQFLFDQFLKCIK